ncbi:sporulation related protein [Roseinatronobacter thiooxidans]|uniref:Sporulation related protein n=1 Tax=Roseinatronobacter thiooxidans TaxID=121821 RepID=A0A2W7QFD8_9RHOB|nr:trypsin-like peptidase domain-containing protein [Roseinatronobacter thiooxidans]PZX47258.1 sporulation related protein [Roseinatronobacter thiooxidans]
MGFQTGRLAFRAASLTAIALVMGMGAYAQDVRWVQIEAQRNLEDALERARLIEQQLSNVNGFRLPSDWYAISVGPFENETEAFSVRRQLRADGIIPADAFVSNGSDYLEQVFPASGTAMTPTPPVQDSLPQAAQTEDPAPLTGLAPEPEPEPQPTPEETLREAQAAERALDRDTRADIQIALQWFGFYNLGIDAAFGPGTRRAMTAWQEDRGHAPTGVLTTAQRTELLEGYRAELAALGMDTWRDEDAGISIDLPLSMVAFDRRETPFVHFSERNDSGVQVLLISQAGTQATLFGLYEIMQTLEIVPLEGLRERRQNSFVLTGQNDTLRSHTVAQFRNGEVKGFTLIWTPERDEQMARVLPMMETSFATFSGSLPASAGQPSTVQRAALLSGLSVRRPQFSRSGFYVDATGTVLTSAAAVAECGRITIDEAYNARVIARDEGLGLAVLRPETPLVPMAFAQFHNRETTLGAEVTIAGFSFEDVMTRPVLTFGRVEGMQGLNGEADTLRLSAEVRQGDLGGPVFGSNGAVIAMLQGQPQDDARQLPSDVNFAVNAAVIQDFLRASNISSGTLREDVVVAPEMLTRMAGDLTVLVSCWN